jgi:hypothetical protein
MRQTDNAERARSWLVDYSAARAKAIEWLGDRYLVARPINRRAASGNVRPHGPGNGAHRAWRS